MKHDYEAALSWIVEQMNKSRFFGGGFVRKYDTIAYALKLAAKLEQEPSKGMIDAAATDKTEMLSFTRIFKDMLDQARKEIEDDYV